LQSAFAASAAPSPEATAFAGKLCSALQAPGSGGNQEPVQLAVCEHLPAAISAAADASPEMARLANSFEKITSQLIWKVRASGGPHASANWPGGHANAVIVGKGGIEERNDVAIGASLLAPHVRYPDHTHPPEELYLVMTAGRFQHGDDAWCDPGPGDTFHNPPGIKHAMASGDRPLLAIWTMLLN